MSVTNAACRLSILLLVITLTACTRLSMVFKPEMPLMPVGDLPGNWQVTESLNYYSSDGVTSVMAAWSKLGDQFRLVLLSSSGQVLSTLTYDGNSIDQKNSLLIGDSFNIPARDIISQLQLYHWPLEKIEKNLQSSSWRLSQENNEKKVLFYKGQPFLCFKKHGDSVVIQYEMLDKQFRVITLQKESIE